MTAADSPEENDLLFRILLAGEELDETASPPSAEGLSEAAAAQLANLKESLESIRIASSTDSFQIDRLQSFNSFSDDFCLSDRFEMIRRLGSGGFGVVVLARDKQLQCNVALKMPRTDILLTKTLVRRFLREAQNVAKLSHPNIVPMLGTDDSSEIPTIVYYYCEGPTLSQWIALQSNPVSAHMAAQIGLLLAEGVLHAHSRGVLHRDLKPSNVLLEKSAEGNMVNGFRDGETVWFPRITDFGISKVLEETEGQTQAGVVMGTLEYMPPEQISGRTGDIGTHSDIYSLGVILYELLAGKVPFSRIEASARGHQSIEQSNSPSVRTVRPDVPRDLDAILQKCMSASEKGRYNTAAELIRELQAFLTNRPVLARPIGRFARLQKWVRRQPLAASLAVACIIMVTLGLTAIIVGDQRTRAINEQLGTTNEHLAQAVIDADRERDLAKQRARDLRLQSYCEDLSSANRALSEGDVSRCDFLLRRHVELKQEDDLRDAAWHYLWQKGHPPFTRVQVSKAPLYSIRFSSDGMRVALCGADGWVRILDAHTTSLIMEWNAEQSEVNCAAFSLDVKYLATAGDDGTICVWDLATQKSISRFRAHADHAFNAVFTSEETLFTCGNEPTIRAWNWRTAEPLGELQQHTKSVQSITLSLDGAILYSASDDGTWCAWNVTTRTLLYQSKNEMSKTVDVQPFPKGKGVISADISGLIRCESVDSIGTAGTEKAVEFLVGIQDSVSAISVTTDGQRIAVASRNGGVNVVDLDESNSTTYGDKASLSSLGSQSVRIHDVSFSPDDLFIHTVDNDGTWTIWNSRITKSSWKLDVTTQFPKESFYIAMDQITRDACIFASNLLVFLWDTETEKLSQLAQLESPVTILVADESKGLVFTGHVNGQVRAWSLIEETLLPLWDFSLQNNFNQIDCLAYSSELQQIAVTYSNAGCSVRIVNAKSGVVSQILEFPGSEAGDTNDLAISSDGKLLACAWENDIIVWNLHNLEFKRLAGHTGTVQSICFHPNGESLVSGSDDRSIRIWEIPTGNQLAELRHHKKTISSIRLSSNGELIISSDFIGSTAIWNTAARKLLFEIDSQAGQVGLAKNWIGPKLFRTIPPNIDVEKIGIE